MIKNIDKQNQYDNNFTHNHELRGAVMGRKAVVVALPYDLRCAVCINIICYTYYSYYNYTYSCSFTLSCK